MHWHLFPLQGHQKARSRFRKISWFLLSVLLLILINGNRPQGVQAQTETDQTNTASQPVRIVNYKSEIVVQKNASLEVTETIELKSNGKEIEQGFYRDFPVGAPFMMGPMQFQVTQVLQNGNPITNYVVNDQGTHQRLQLEPAGIKLAANNYTYTIEYQIDRQLDFSDPNTDRLYWDVTGHDWHYPIEQVKAKVWLPEGISKQDLRLNAFVGKQGDRSNHYEAELNSQGNPTFITTKPLQAQESLTIIVEFPSGYVERPSFTETLTYVFNKALIDLFATFSKLGALLVIVIFLVILLIAIFSKASFPLMGNNRDQND